jgi:hypothetical protein
VRAPPPGAPPGTPPGTPPSASGPSPGRTLALLGLALAGLVLLRWTVTGTLSRPLAPPALRPTPSSSVDEPGPTPAQASSLRGNLLYLGGRQVLLVDPASGQISPVPSPGAGRIRVLRQGGFIVMLSRDGGVAVAAAVGDSTQHQLGQASDVLPSQRPDRVWLVSQGDGVPDETYTLREVDLRSLTALRRWTLPYDAEPVAVVPQGVVVRNLEDDFEVRSRGGKRVARLGRDLTFLDVHGSLIAYLDDRELHLRDLATGLDRRVALPAGARSWFALGPPLPGTGCCLQIGSFSPDGATLAVFTGLDGPTGPGLTIVDVAEATATVLPGSGGATPVACQPCLGWSQSGWLFFFNGGPALADPSAWRPGVREAVPLGLDVRSATTVLPSGIAPA